MGSIPTFCHCGETSEKQIRRRRNESEAVLILPNVFLIQNWADFIQQLLFERISFRRAMAVKEEHPLLRPVMSGISRSDDVETSNNDAKPDALVLQRNFIIMAISFSINHGTVCQMMNV